MRTLAIAAIVIVALAGPLRGQSEEPVSTVDAVRHELLQLPYYSVFDFLAFTYRNGTVTLMGYASTPTLRIDAERAVKRAPGVDAVVDDIAVLPISLTDDDLRWNLYYVIYRDPLLLHYSPGGGVLWGHRHTFPAARLLAYGPVRFLGTEPAGDYPVHIVVDSGRVTLLGVVDSESDKARAGALAISTAGASRVENELTVDAPIRETDR